MSTGVYRRGWWRPPRPASVAALTKATGASLATLTPAIETDTAQALTRRRLRTLTPATETDQAVTLTSSAPAPAAAGYLIDIDWAQPTTDAFRIGVSTIDGSAPLTNTLSAVFTSDDDVTGDVMTVQVRRGRDDRLDVFRASTATIVLSDPTGRYNPANTASDLAGSVRPMRQVRVRYDDAAGGTYGLWRGFVRAIEHDPDPSAQRTVVEASDLLWYMDRTRPTIGAATNQTVGTIIGQVLDEIGWTDTALRDLDTDGQVITTFEADGSTSALELVRGLLEVDRGDFYIDASGVATYRSRYTRYLSASAGTISDSYMDTRPSVDIERIRNRARVVHANGTATAADADSVATYGYLDATDIQTTYLTSDDTAQSLAAFIVAASRDGESPATMRLMNVTDTIRTEQVTRELGDRITVVSERAAIGTVDYHIEGIDHDITAAGKYHTTRWVLSRAQGGAIFVIGESALGDPNILVY